MLKPVRYYLRYKKFSTTHFEGSKQPVRFLNVILRECNDRRIPSGFKGILRLWLRMTYFFLYNSDGSEEANRVSRHSEDVSPKNPIGF